MAETAVATVPAVAPAGTPGWQRYLRFGAGLAIELRRDRLEALLVQVRPGGIRALAHEVVEDYTRVPASAWGERIRRMGQQHDIRHVGATVVVPRRDVTVRQIFLTGVPEKDIPSALALQIDALHPYGDEAVVHAWRALPDTRGGLLVGIMREERLLEILSLFAEAGVPVGAFTFAAAAVHATLRLASTPPAGFCTWAEGEDGFEVYGESPSRPVFTAELDLPLNRALGLAVSELRVTAERVTELAELLPKAQTADGGKAVLYAAALSNACPWLTAPVNLLSPERRTAKGRVWIVPTIFLTVLLVLAGIALLMFPSVADRKYLEQLRAEMARVDLTARQAARLDKQAADLRARAALLDRFHTGTQADLDALHELTRMLAPPVWVNLMEIYPDSVMIGGEAPQAEPLLRLLNSSPLFQNAEFVTTVVKANGAEQFRIKLLRKARP